MRHPVGGSRKLFWGFMLALYAVVAGVIAMTIVAAAGLQIYLLGEPNYHRYVKVIQASSILIILYSLTSISLLGLAFSSSQLEKMKICILINHGGSNHLIHFILLKRRTTRGRS